MALELRLLGPVEVHAGGQVLAIGVPQRRVVLAALAVDAGRMVTRQQLIDRVWDTAPPAGVDSAVYAHVARLRAVMGQANAVENPAAPAALDRRTGGYLLRVDPDVVDLHRFRRLVTEAAEAGRPAADRLPVLREALELWRGAPLAGLPGDWVARVRDSWERERLAAVLAWAAAELAAGDPAATVGPLTELAGEHPVAEPVAAALMRSLAAVGRPADALDQYAATRRQLAEELGADPGPELRDAYRAVLAAGAGGPATMAAVAPPAAEVPAQLPGDVAAFTGRGPELAALDSLSSAMAPATADGVATAVPIAVISGTAGVGKTALAVHWGHRAAARFPDGQLYVNLRGYDPDQPVDPADALAGFLAALGVPSHDIPVDADGRAARYRTGTAGRRMLVVLDNAASAEQVRPLLPGTASCAVVVTSRDSMAGLVAVHGARRLELDLLPAADAVTLLRRLVGPRVDADPAAATLADQCAHLPLALRIAAELAAARPAATLTALVEELADQRRRLAALTAGGDPRADVTGVFSWSVRHLPADAARVFRLLGLHPGLDFDAAAVAALAGFEVDRARDALDRLAAAHLVQHAAGRGGDGRYGMHDLLRAYARGLVEAAADAPHEALTRLFDYYLAAAAACTEHLYPGEVDSRASVPATTAVPVPAGPDAARDWLDTERPVLVKVAAHTATHGWPAHSARLSAVAFRYLLGGHFAEAVQIHGHAVEAARGGGDLAAEAAALTSLAATYVQLSRYTEATGMLERALELAVAAGDVSGQARAVANLGMANGRQGRYRPACVYTRRALVLYRRAGDRAGRARALSNLATYENRLGLDRDADRHHEEALRLFRELGNRVGEAWALNRLGIVEVGRGRYAAAVEHLRQALAIQRQLGNRTGEAEVLDSLGTAHLRLDEPDRAAAHFTEALEVFRETGDHDGELWTLNGLGEAARLAGQPAAALDRHAAALAAAVAAGARQPQAAAHAGLGDAHDSLGDTALARQHLARALALYTELGMPEAAAVRERLERLDSGEPDSGERDGAGE